MKRKRQKLDKIFDCIPCYEEKCIEIIEGKGAGYLRCNQCEVRFESDIYDFNDKIDIYIDWVDKFDVTGRYKYSDDDNNLSIQQKSKSINSKGKSRASNDLNTCDKYEYSQYTYVMKLVKDLIVVVDELNWGYEQ
ncbi:2914_t:CDS:2 [Gigaspora margarita]|uniref:Transcription elongation factor 1 homolog n=1 Tax=Gigaspora margarita TaxID=4874 RepID=A0ABN7UQM5_GIGMA|nr:2914_t:CDS:2 [Gigaspora margarita]